MKYLVGNLVGVIHTNQCMARRCYDESTHALEGKRGKHITRVHLLELDPRFDREDTKPQLDEDLKESQVGLELYQRMKIGASLDPGVEEERSICMDPYRHAGYRPELPMPPFVHIPEGLLSQLEEEKAWGEEKSG
ncbi:hypothetical protein CR513_54375, partial [Mucuna pruriens]